MTPLPEFRTCGKRKHPSRAHANIAMRNMWRKPHTGKLPCRVYYCPKCSAWHTTSRPAMTTAQQARPS